MPCNYFGKIIPGGDRASCVAGGGTWVPEPSLNQPPLIEPSLMRRPPGMTRPDSDLGSGPMNLPTRPLGISYPGGSALQDPAKVSLFHSDTDDFGQPLDYNTGPQGEVYNLFGERDRLLAQSEADNFGPRKVAFDSKVIPETSLIDRIKMHRRAQLNPPKDSMGLYGGKPTIPYTEEDALGANASMVDPVTGKPVEVTGINPEWDKPIEDATMDLVLAGYYPAKIGNKIVQKAWKLLATPKGLLLTGYGADKYFKNQEEANAWIAKQSEMATSKVSSVIKTDTAKDTPVDKPTAKPGDINIFNNKEKSKRPEGVQGPLNEGGIWNPSELTKAAKTGNIDKGLLDKMGTKDFWMTGIEGGAGDWDNRLFRLGEMMAYMGTPLSKRGKNPAARWTAANTEQSKIKAAVEKERLEGLTDANKTGSIFGKVPTGTTRDTIITELKKKPWFLGMGQQYNEEELEALGNKGELIFAEWYKETKDVNQALEETLKELQLGL